MASERTTFDWTAFEKAIAELRQWFRDHKEIIDEIIEIVGEDTEDDS